MEDEFIEIFKNEMGKTIIEVFKTEQNCTWKWDKGIDAWLCSNCGPVSAEDYRKIPNYCPECGYKVHMFWEEP